MPTTENMRYLFKGIQIDARTREYIEKRLSTLDRFVENVLATEVEIDLDKKGKFRVEAMIRTPRNVFRADNTTDSIEASIDMAVDELQTQVTHLKDRLRTLKKKGGSEIKSKLLAGDGEAAM